MTVRQVEQQRWLLTVSHDQVAAEVTTPAESSQEAAQSAHRRRDRSPRDVDQARDEHCEAHADREPSSEEIALRVVEEDLRAVVHTRRLVGRLRSRATVDGCRTDLP